VPISRNDARRIAVLYFDTGVSGQSTYLLVARNDTVLGMAIRDGPITGLANQSADPSFSRNDAAFAIAIRNGSFIGVANQRTDTGS
jgi:hypothetical protein